MLAFCSQRARNQPRQRAPCFLSTAASAAPAMMPRSRAHIANDNVGPSHLCGHVHPTPDAVAWASDCGRVRRAALVAVVLSEAAGTFWRNPFAYCTIPVVAALVGYGTNWVGVKMIFYPIRFWGIPIKRWPETPLGLFGWQGIVPTKVKKMSQRLVDLITTRLLSVKEAFAGLDARHLAGLLEDPVLHAIEKDAPWGEAWSMVVKPSLRSTLNTLTRRLQTDIEQFLDLREVVSTAFARDKVLLGELFQQAGKRELKFLVDSGLSFGFFLGIIQMMLWIIMPTSWSLPLGGALVGYITNWVAIKLIFDPVEPTRVGPFVLQGLFEKRQAEVSDDFSEFLAQRVLNSPRLMEALVDGRHSDRFKAMIRETVPSAVPDSVTEAAVGAFRKLVHEPESHPVHKYVNEKLDLQDILAKRLKSLTSAEFENLLHPVFQEDELTLIIAGGVLGAAAGALQMFFGWGGPPSSGPVAAAGASVAMLLPPLPLLAQLWWVAAFCVAAVTATRGVLRRALWWLHRRRFPYAKAAAS